MRPNQAPSQPSYGRVAKFGVLWGLIREGGSAFLLLPTSMVLARLLTPQEAGIAAAATFFLQLCARLTQFGFGASLVRLQQITPAHISSVFVANLALGSAACSILFFAAPAAGSFLRSPETAVLIRIAAIGFLITPFATVPTALLSRDMRFRENTTSEWIAIITESLLAILLAWSGFSSASLIYGRLAGDATRAVSRTAMTGWTPRLRYSRLAMKDMFSFGLGIYAKTILDFTANNIDNLIVGRMLGMSALGFYDKAYATMYRLTAKLNLSGPSVSFRVFSLIEGDHERFRRAYRKVILSVAMISYPVLTGLIITAPQVIEVLFGTPWLAATAPFQILCAASYLRLLNTYASSATQAKGKVWSEVTRQAIFTATLIASLIAFSPWGIAGAAFGVLLATAGMTMMLQSLVRRLAGLRWSDMLQPLGPGILCSLGLSVVLVASRSLVWMLWSDAEALPLLAISIALSALYVVTFLRFAPIPQVRSLVREILEDMAPALRNRFRWLVEKDPDTTAASLR